VAHGYERALRHLGHHVRAFNYHTQLAFYDKAFRFWNAEKRVENEDEAILLLASEQAVLEAVDFVPHWVLIVNGFALHRRAYDLLDRLCLPMAILLTESPWLDAEQATIASQGHVRLVFTNERESVRSLHELTGLPVVYLPHSYNSGIHFPQRVNGEHESDLFFAGTMWPERLRLVDGLERWARRYHKGWNIDIRRVNMMTGRNSDALIANEELARRYCGTRIALNHHRTVRSIDGQSGTEKHQQATSLGPRAYEIAACSAFQLCDAQPELAEVFGDSVATYADAKDLRRKVTYYLANDAERHQMAAEANRRVLRCSFEQRAADILLPAMMEVHDSG